jgi:methylated-DNA-[protein]-cysteine S-methyltransferase
MRDRLRVASFESELGWMAIAGTETVLAELTFGHSSPREAIAGLSCLGGDEEEVDADWQRELVERLQAYAGGDREDFSDVTIALTSVTPFQRRVVQACRAIPYGQTRTYGEIAAAVGVPQAARAVGNVMAANCTPLVVPCHRVITASGVLGRYSAGEGTRTKLRLIETEAQSSMSGPRPCTHADAPAV